MLQMVSEGVEERPHTSMAKAGCMSWLTLGGAASPRRQKVCASFVCSKMGSHARILPREY